MSKPKKAAVDAAERVVKPVTSALLPPPAKPQSVVVAIDWLDQPEDVIGKFSQALLQLGIRVCETNKTNSRQVFRLDRL